MTNIEELIAGLRDKSNYACQCMKKLQEESIISDAVYPYFDSFIKMLDDPNSYIRTRGILLIAANVRWDKEHKIDSVVDCLLTHITDEKPITSRQCIQALPEIAKHKPHLAGKICAALNGADPSKYADSMQPLVEKDIRSALQIILDTAAAQPCPCGAVCSDCRHYPNECAGCRMIEGNVWWLAYTGQDVCPFYTCCIGTKHLPHCGMCVDFPCALFHRGDPTKSDEENAEILKKQIEILTKENK